MPVFKFKTLEEAEKAFWNFHPDESYFRKVAQLWKFANKLSPLSCRKGIFKYRTIEEANQERDEWELIRAKNLHSKRSVNFH